MFSVGIVMRKMSRIACIVFFSIFSAFGFAESVGIQVIQKDGNIKEIRQTSYVVENTILDGFFDKGYIATTAPVAISESDEKDSDVLKKVLEEALEGHIDILTVVFVEYKMGDSIVTANVLLNDVKKITWKLYDVQTGLPLVSQEYEIQKSVSKYSGEDGVVRFSKNVFSDIVKALKKV